MLNAYNETIISGITQVAEVMVSIRRLQNFMMYEEVSTRADRSMIYRKDRPGDKKKKSSENGKAGAGEDEIHNGKLDGEEGSEDGVIKLIGASAKWLVFEKEDALHDINIDVRPGELVAVVGQVGSGKSSLLQVILKELPLTAGTVQVCTSRQLPFRELRAGDRSYTTASHETRVTING